MNNFHTFKTAVAEQFRRMSAHQLFRTGVEPDALWAQYLGAFQDGTNPMYRERTEHDCSGCRRFIRAVGNIVAVVDGRLTSVWDTTVPNEPAYQAVADALAHLVKSAPIVDRFLHQEPTAGVDRDFEKMADGGQVTWQHFYIDLPKQYVKASKDIPTALAGPRDDHQVLRRSLTELTEEAVDTALDLISQNSLYRGEEFRGLLEEFRKLQRAFRKLTTDQERDLFCWTTPASGALARIRNTAIGTLLQNLSADMDLEAAVRAFEAVMAPANYRRPTALVTQGMIEKAKLEVEQLGLTSALERRYARLRDITANNILFADRAARPLLSGSVFDDLAASTVRKPRNLDKIEEIGIDRFISEMLPRIDRLEVLLENRHTRNLVSLIAPQNPTSGDLFRWPNRFSWSYNGEIADSDMRQAVVARGGSVTGVFRFTHMWNYGERNASLMDLHVFMPGNGTKAENGVHDTYGGNYQRVGWNHRKHAQSCGVQDVDYTDAAPVGHVPVENITFPDLNRMPEGTYICKVHNWALRSPTQGGFRAEIEFGGTVYEYEYPKPLKNKEWITVAEVTLKAGQFTIRHHLPCGQASRPAWGLPTESFHRANLMLLSPNHWDDRQIGNRHYLFMLDGCRNDTGARGFYNEFLKDELRDHRKVLELVGSKLKIADDDEQLSGLGFSSTQRNTLVCRVSGSITRPVKITF